MHSSLALLQHQYTTYFFFCRIPVVLENRRSSRGGGGGAHTLHPPPRSAPESRIQKECFFYRLKYYCCAYGNLNVKNYTAFTNIVDKHKRYVNTTCRGNATAKIRPMVRESKLQESGKFLLVVFGIREIFARGIRDPTNDWNYTE